MSPTELTISPISFICSKLNDESTFHRLIEFIQNMQIFSFKIRDTFFYIFKAVSSLIAIGSSHGLVLVFGKYWFCRPIFYVIVYCLSVYNLLRTLSIKGVYVCQLLIKFYLFCKSTVFKAKSYWIIDNDIL